MDFMHAKLENFLAHIWWLAMIGRVPTKIPDYDSPKPNTQSKAGAAFMKTEKLLRDRWKVYRIHLARQAGSNVDPKTFEDDNLTMDMNYLHHFKVVLDACAAIHIWTVWSTSFGFLGQKPTMVDS
ncbi:hypothetical protein HETIRDRAFT_421337 [Heterobasidion irregulare TC 32-1]|uniref:Uncharacterized protein n=1 Tax=Heterobasidion irregulare (strain TC 32-1) TaxID=747525 RepID=W4JUF6_HETIT|nr:uncharacterized protein HETIRDRAFT_421337 [Heterobasidion irregulare TC 32-1]ETW77182.1 hypothetical protein HETIRDRAFT_421337 [Heterobasidion irregulare TC 32-1]